MGYKTFVSMNIAIIGISEIATSYASAFSGAGHEVYRAWKESDNARAGQSVDILDDIHVCSIEDAAEVADIIIIATPRIDVREVSYWLGDVRCKVIIDATSNVVSDADEQVKTACAIKAITGSPHVVKAFHTRGYEQFLKPLFNGGSMELIMVGDCKKAKEVTRILALDLGISNCYDFGGNSTIPLFNAMTNCWREFVIKSNPAAKPADILIPYRH